MYSIHVVMKERLFHSRMTTIGLTVFIQICIEMTANCYNEYFNPAGNLRLKLFLHDYGMT